MDPGIFRALAGEESTADPVNERVSRLQTRRLKVLASKEGKHRIKCCLQTLSDTQSLFEIELANEVNMLNTGDPVLKRVAALTTGGDDTPNRRTFAIRTGASTSDVTPKNVATPLSSGYRPELDLSPELGSKQLNYYQGLIGVLRWICEIGRIDILMPVSMMSRYLVSAR
ncbi:Reverse transcriptase (RNA-dependent DNA polymerase) [Fragilaria crotonensis]|nr:Reverse transcriptase (RNA-dependent DNA polymerase) [Fragilaria crotonensis]